MAEKPNFTVVPHPQLKTKRKVTKAMRLAIKAAHTPAARKKASETRRRNFLAKQAAGLPAVVGREIHLDEIRDIMAPERKPKAAPRPAQSQAAMDIAGELLVSVVQALLKRGLK